MRVEVCRTEEIGDGSLRRYDIPGHEPIAVYNLGGEFFATADNCSHKGASLAAGWIEGGAVVCPWHLGAFDIRTGQGVAPPCYRSVQTYPTEVVAGVLVVILPD
ncbi:MAG: non-heme iron oxygenase ferredoxin subunit [Gammaproteobacteria bacterium]